jgi:hypothetical protein
LAVEKYQCQLSPRALEFAYRSTLRTCGSIAILRGACIPSIAAPNLAAQSGKTPVECWDLFARSDDLGTKFAYGASSARLRQ